MTTARKAPAKKAAAAEPEKKSPVLDPENVDDVTGFDMDAWMDDAKPATASAVVYKRADLFGELQDVERKIEQAGDGDDMGSNDAGANALRAQWEQLAKKIEDSKVTVVVRAITDDAAKLARKGAKDEGVKEKAAAEWESEDIEDEVIEAARDEAEIDDLDDDETEALIRKRKVQARRQFINAKFDEAVGEHLLVRLLVRPKMTLTQVRELSEQIGSTQSNRLAKLIHEASGEVRIPTPPFSRSSSRGRRGGTSSKRSGQRGRGASRR